MTGVQPDLAARVAATRERLELDAETWNPAKQAEHPREIAGLVVERRTLPGAGHNGKDAEQMLVQEPNDHCWKFRLYGQVLQNELAGVGVGDVVAIRYGGWVNKPGVGEKDGYHLWSVSVDQGGPRAPAPPPVEQQPPRAVGMTDPLTTHTHVELEQPVEPEAPLGPAPKKRFCAACGTLEPEHADGCEYDIPF